MKIADATRTVVRTGAFWVAMIAMLPGLGVSVWFSVRILGVPFPVALWLAVATAVIAVVVAICALYRVQSTGGALGIPLRGQPELARTALTQEILASVSVLLAAGVAIYFVADGQLGTAALTLITGMVIWQAIRVALRRRRRVP